MFFLQIYIYIVMRTHVKLRALNDVDPSKFKFPMEDVRRMQAQFSKVRTYTNV